MAMKFTSKISDMPAWGSRVFGGNNQKQEEHQAAVTKKQHHSGWFGQKKTATTTSSLTQHCSTCQCPRSDKDVPTKDMKSTSSTNTEMKGKKEERIIAVNKDGKTHASTEAKKNEKIKDVKHNEKKEERSIAVNKDGENFATIKAKKNEKIKDVKHNASAEKKKKKKDKKEHGAGTKVEPCNAIMKKENKEEHVNHCFPKTAEHWKDKVTVKNKDGKHNDGSSSSSDSDSEDEASKKRKKEKKHSQGTKTISK